MGDIQTETECDRLGRVTGHRVQKNSLRLSEKSYLWSTNDKLLGILESGKETRFEYDGWGNLSKTVFEDRKTELRNPDRTGNLFESLDRMDRKYAKGGQLVKTERWEYKYDKQGNLIRKKDKHGQTWRYEWNDAGMLSHVKRPDGVYVSFKYDALGRRIEKRFGKRETRWLWDGNVPLNEERATVYPDYSEEQGYFDRIEKRPTITWVFEEGTFVPTAKLTKEEKLSIVTNYLGTPEAMYSEEGETVWQCELNSYGKVREYRGDTKTDCPFRYQGQYEDAETGLYYNRFRYYSPEEGIYLSQDPIKLAGGNPTFYGYVFDPNTQIDLFGLSCDEAENKNKLPELPETFAKEFETLRVKKIKKGSKIYRSPWIPNETTDNPGKWFGTRKTATAKGTDSMYQIEKWSNPNKIQRVYETTEDVYVYYGKVKGGTGY